MGDAIADYYEAYHPSLLSLAPRPASSNPPTISLVARGGNRTNSNSKNRRSRRTVNHGWPRPKLRPTDTGNIDSSNAIMKTSSQPPRVVSDEELVQYAYNTIFR